MKKKMFAIDWQYDFSREEGELDYVTTEDIHRVFSEQEKWQLAQSGDLIEEE